MRFEEKVAAEPGRKFAVIFGRHGFQSAVLQASRVGVRDIFYFSDLKRGQPGVNLQYFDYETFDFEELKRWMNPPWRAGWNLNKLSAEKAAELDETARRSLKTLDDRLFDPQFRVELELPYRLGPLCFMEGTIDPFETRIEIVLWPETIRPYLKSLADRLGTQVVFVREFNPEWALAAVYPNGVRIVDSKREVRTGQPAPWAPGLINLLSPGHTRLNTFCVCDFAKEEVVWVKCR